MRNPNQVFFIILAILLLMSCRKEAYELVEAPKEKGLEANSKVAMLMQRTSMNDGSNDNIIDRANCFNVRLPIVVSANSQQINVNSEEDFGLIEAVFDEFSTDEDVLEIIFPIEVILNDFSEVNVNTLVEFTNLVSQCAGENVDDDDIECIDFLYPISASIFNKTKESTSRISITDDKQLYGFIDDLEDNLVASVDFPVTMVLSDKTQTIINDLTVLEAIIEGADNVCDEDDDYDYNDDDIYSQSEQQFADLLTMCNWVIEEIKINDQDLTNTHDQYNFTFNTDGSIEVNLDGVISFGTWSITTANENKILHITIDSLTNININININNDWILSEIELEENGPKIELKKGEDELEFQQNCN